jgi:hypothetical protein
VSRPRSAWKRLKDAGWFFWWLIAGVGCAAPQVPEAEMAAAVRASTCKVAIDKAIERAEHCPEAQLAIDTEPACKEFGHLDLHCKEFK